MRFVRARVSDEQVAEDVLQETFLRIHARLDSLGDDQRLASWVFQIARNIITDHHRSKAHSPSGFASEMEATADGPDNLNEQTAGWARTLIEQLPDANLAALHLYEIEGLSQQAIADRLNISLSGAKSRIQRGRAKLKTLLHACCTFAHDRRGNIID
jgi:RNA polymerase sigma-70 factor (ECF subfamily)